ncbi:beta-glucosidase [Punctularia strigosozonata HHB-11173 SS5]|uniref:beta-glucosidase n=1 Tax=Punctularia strigosozonata (strain HHB-11173) TaxID=741275 RepID=UPI00044181E8|nr:beta-glucosidase [Punctularia strigosozonata HHB-11173 SS5]EIN05767.1 beta-glucosidase [Punctularia strigosozonata HHB-11173 SS5]
MFLPYPSPTPATPDSEFIPVTPANPLPVQDPLNGPWLVPDFTEAWNAAWEKAQAFIANLTLEEKVNVTTGVGWMKGRCVGHIPPVGSFPGLCLEDSPLGVRFADYVTAFPSGLNTAATWNRTLMRLRGSAMGSEFRAKGVHAALGPMMNIMRVPQGGRVWEGFGADPFLAGEAAYETILGMQSVGVQAVAKHYINNEQEHARTMSSSNVDDRTEHEIYVHPFLRSVMAGVASVMCSYNLINGTYACSNDKTLNGILKDELGFRGYVQSDWQATHATLDSMMGLDMTMPGDVTFGSGDSFFGGNMTAYVQNGTIPEAKVDDMATRILAAWYLLEQDEGYPDVNFNAWNLQDPLTNEHVNAQEDHMDVVRAIGAASTVLLKNANETLPLKKPRSVAVIGSDAGPQRNGPNEFADRGGVDGVLAMGWGSGTCEFPYLVSPLESLQARARHDRAIFTWFLNDYDLVGAATAAIGRDVALVFINADSGEDYITVDGNEGDRFNLTAWHNGDELILAVAAQNNNTVVVAHSVGPLIVEPWIDHPNVTALIWAGIPGQEAGNSLVDVLYGDVNPSGRLPYTIAKNASDYPASLVLGGGSEDILSITYNEGLLVDYRAFDALGRTPRFEFGFGLSYTQFEYDNLTIFKIEDEDVPELHGLEESWEGDKPSPSGYGSSVSLWLHRPAYSVNFDVRNVGERFGGEIPQVYLHFPSDSGEPPAVLKGFTDVVLRPGESKRVTVNLSRYDLSVWDVPMQAWQRPKGDIGVTVGASSRDGRLTGVIEADDD